MVVDETTGKMYGHIVSGEPMSGLAYIIPAYKVFDDIAKQFGVHPSFADDGKSNGQRYKLISYYHESNQFLVLQLHQNPAIDQLDPSTIPQASKEKPSITFEGWTLTKRIASSSKEKPTRALIVSKMMLSQNEFRKQVTKLSKRGQSVIEQLNDMNGFEKKHIERFIDDKVKAETDPRVEYQLASIKLEHGKFARSKVTISMQVILKRISVTEVPITLVQGRDQGNVVSVLFLPVQN